MYNLEFLVNRPPSECRKTRLPFIHGIWRRRNSIPILFDSESTRSNIFDVRRLDDSTFRDFIIINLFILHANIVEIWEIDFDENSNYACVNM